MKIIKFNNRIYTNDIFWIVFLLIEYNFLYLVNIPQYLQKFMTGHNKFILMLITVFWCIISLKNISAKSLKWVLSFLFIVIMSILMSVMNYDASAGEIIVCFSAYLLIIAVFPLGEYVDKHYRRFVYILTIINILACVSLLTQAVLYNCFDIGFINMPAIIDDSVSAAMYYRNGRIRVQSAYQALLAISMIISSNNVIYHKSFNIKMDIINFFLSMLFLVYVAQTRILIFSVVFCIVLDFYCSLGYKRKNSAIKRFLSVSVMLLVAVSLGLGNVLLQLIEPFRNGSYLEEGSYFARIEAIPYYLKMLFKYPITGLGAIMADKGSAYYQLIHGKQGYLNFSDVGIIGSIAKFGVFILLWYILFINRLYKITKNNKNLKVWLSYIFITSFTLSLFDPQRVPALIVIFSIVSAMERRHNNEKRAFISDKCNIKCN